MSRTLFSSFLAKHDKGAEIPVGPELGALTLRGRATNLSTKHLVLGRFKQGIPVYGRASK